MSLQNRGWDLPRNRAFEGIAHGGRLSGIGHATKDDLRFHDLPDRHGDGFSGHRLEAAEPTLCPLLASAGFVQRDDEVRRLCLEVGWRIVEGQMTILPDPDKSHVDPIFGDQRVQALALRLRILVRVDVMENADGYGKPVYETFFEIPAKRGSVVPRKADVFIEMESGHPRPVEVRFAREVAEHLELRGAGRQDDTGCPVVPERRPNTRRPHRRGVGAQFLLRFEDADAESHVRAGTL